MIDLGTLTTTACVLLVVAALLLGLSKTAVGGLGMDALYLLHVRLPLMAFLGTTAWFFFTVNLVCRSRPALGLVTRTPCSSC